MRSDNWHHRNTKCYKKIPWTVTCQQIGQSRRNAWTPRNIQSSKTEARRTSEQTDYNYWNQSSSPKTLLPKKQKPKWFHMWIVPNIERRTPNLLKLFLKTEGERRHPSSFYEDSITGIPKAHKDFTKEANIPDGHRYKNPQQNVSKLNSIIH